MRLTATGIGVTLSGRAVLRSVSLTLEPGAVVGLLGPNGAGKSTLMRALVAQVPCEGAIALGGRDLRTLSHGERARLLAYLPQRRAIGWPVTVRDAVALGRMPWLGFGLAPGEADRRICEAAMALMDVAHLAGRRATELSGGEQARVIAARAIAQDTPVLIADEPASGLDPAHQITMMMTLRRLAGEGRAVLVSLHDLTLAARWCDRLLVLDDGAPAAEGVPEDVLTPDLLRDVFRLAARIERDEGGLVLTPLGLAE